MHTHGKYIVIEGHDGVGKSTQAALLRERLASVGIESTLLHEPGSTPIGNELRKLLKDGRIPRDERQTFSSLQLPGVRAGSALRKISNVAHGLSPNVTTSRCSHTKDMEAASIATSS